MMTSLAINEKNFANLKSCKKILISFLFAKPHGKQRKDDTHNFLVTVLEEIKGSKRHFICFEFLGYDQGGKQS